MEAAGFLRGLMQSGASAESGVMKIISDNRTNPTQRINAKMVVQMILNRAPEIRQLAQSLIESHG
jgi:hypothetical protein